MRCSLASATLPSVYHVLVWLPLCVHCSKGYEVRARDSLSSALHTASCHATAMASGHGDGGGGPHHD